MTYTDIVLIALVWAVVGLAVVVGLLWRRYRNWIRSTDSDFSFVYDQLSALYRRVEALEESHDTTADLDVPTIHRSVPEHFNEWR